MNDGQPKNPAESRIADSDAKSATPKASAPVATGDEASLLIPLDAAQPLGKSEQTEYVRLITRGASPAAACRSLRISLTSVLLTREQDKSFRAQIELAESALRDNVLAAVYRSAMEGKVTAQTFYLRFLASSVDAEAGGESIPNPDYDDMTDEELWERIQALSSDLADELARLRADDADAPKS